MKLTVKSSNNNRLPVGAKIVLETAEEHWLRIGIYDPDLNKALMVFELVRSKVEYTDDMDGETSMEITGFHKEEDGSFSHIYVELH